MTVHINALKEDISNIVIMPGDPNRAKRVAETYLDDYKLVNTTRGMLGYTGNYKGKKVTVMASGMGNPSMGIYSYELYHAYNVENIIRIGTCGALKKEIKVKDLIVATGACTDSNYANSFGLKGVISAVPSFKLLKKADEMVKKLGFQDKTRFGQLLTTDVFYKENGDSLDWTKMGVLCVEMEAYGLYLNAARAGKHAIAICSVSDNIVSKQELTAEERTKSVNDMILLALEMAADLD